MLLDPWTTSFPCTGTIYVSIRLTVAGKIQHPLCRLAAYLHTVGKGTQGVCRRYMTRQLSPPLPFLLLFLPHHRGKQESIYRTRVYCAQVTVPYVRAESVGSDLDPVTLVQEESTENDPNYFQHTFLLLTRWNKYLESSLLSIEPSLSWSTEILALVLSSSPLCLHGNHDWITYLKKLLLVRKKATAASPSFRFHIASIPRTFHLTLHAVHTP